MDIARSNGDTVSPKKVRACVGFALCLVCGIMKNQLNISSSYDTLKTSMDAFKITNVLFEEKRNQSSVLHFSNIDATMNGANKSSVITPYYNYKKKDSIKYLYYQHVRKCGGAVGAELIKNTTARGCWNEYHSFPSGCVDAPEANQTLFFTMLRDPADRYASEFRYQNLHGPTRYNLSETASTPEEVREAVRHWVNQSQSCMRPDSWRVKCFYSNMYVRLFSGKQRCILYEMPDSASGKQIFLKWSGSPLDVSPKVTELDYLTALQVLKKFDLVLTTKKLGPPATEKAISVGLNVSRESTWNSTAHATKSRFSILDYEGVREILEEHLQYDIQLFKYFDSIANDPFN